MSVSVFLDLAKRQADVVSNGAVRTLMRAVAQDAQNETIDYKKSAQPILQAYNGNTEARIMIMSFLNSVFVVFHDFDSVKDASSIYSTWLWENHTRLMKLLTISMVLESANLRSFGPDVRPKWDDIPQALVHLFLVIKKARADIFPFLKQQYEDKVKRIVECDLDYIDLYTSDRPEKKQK